MCCEFKKWRARRPNSVVTTDGLLDPSQTQKDNKSEIWDTDEIEGREVMKEAVMQEWKY